MRERRDLPASDTRIYFESMYMSLLQKVLRSLGAPLLFAGLILLPVFSPAAASAQPSSPQVPQLPQALEYKMVTGFKQPFNDDLQLHLSKGWSPVGGIAVTVWNNDLYFAVLLSRQAGR